MLIEKRAALEKELIAANDEAAEHYLTINGDNTNEEYIKRRTRIMNLHYEISILFRLTSKGHK
jgi:seryl-tRNA(Sec) selenium transferase